MTTPADNDVGTEPPAGPKADAEPETAPETAPQQADRSAPLWERRWVRITAVMGGVGAILGTVLAGIQLYRELEEPDLGPPLPVLQTGETAPPCFPISVRSKPPQGYTWVLAVSSLRDRHTYFYRVPPGTSRMVPVSLDAGNPKAAYGWWDIELWPISTEVVDHVRDAVGITDDRPWKASVMPPHDEVPHSIKVQRGVGQDSC
jgi:hypothetical protein